MNRSTALFGLSLLPLVASCGSVKEQATSAATGSGGDRPSTVSSSSGSSSTSTTSTTSSSSGTRSSSTAASSSSSGAPGSVTGISGGMLDVLSFAIVGDTRPPNEDDVAGYPTAIITKIWQDVEAASPRPAFAVTTGDYQYSNPSGSVAAQQLALYVTARKAFSNVTFPAMGNHECTGYTTSNCGVGNPDGITANYTAYSSALLTPLGVTLPYYTANIASTTGKWTAKIIVIAANYWDTTQEIWLEGEMAKPTTYTFVVRHESKTSNTAPGVVPSEAVLTKYPYTLALVGHTHEYRYDQSTREVLVGNGGAPLSGTSNYGYVIARQRADGAIVFTSYEYDTNAVVETFAVTADGTPTQ